MSNSKLQILKKVNMNKICCIKCNKHGKVKNTQILYIFDKSLVIIITDHIDLELLDV